MKASRTKSRDVPQKSKYKNYLIIFAIIFGICSIILITLHKNEEIKVQARVQDPEKIVEIKKCDRLKYWSVVIEEWHDNGSLRSMNRVFARMNYKFVNASLGDDWDILWSLETPYVSGFKHEPLFCNVSKKPLLIHQKSNHFPGITVLIVKSYMAQLNRNQNYILPFFVLPKDQEKFEKFIVENPSKKILEKNIYNRGVKIVDAKEVIPKNETFYQEFMDNPFLIDGHAFDFGVFVLITSFNPLRVYRFNEEVLLRFCSEKYHPFDPQNRNKYVVKDGSTPVYEMPSFKELYKNYSYSSKIMFENIISKSGHDVKELWKKIDQSIFKIIKNSEYSIVDKLIQLNYSSHHFFELVRFDIILDAELNPFVVEVNMSPNLTPADKKYEENSLIYEQLIHNVVKMIGGSSYHEFYSRFDPTSTIVSNHKNLATSLTKCLKYDCINNCNRTYCQMCHPCMTDEVRYQLSEAFREHQHAANFKRVFPVSDHFNNEKLIEKMTKKNQIQMRWWKGKCEDDARWC